MKDPAAQKLGRKGAKAKWAKTSPQFRKKVMAKVRPVLTKEQRSQQARKAVNARWKKVREAERMNQQERDRLAQQFEQGAQSREEEIREGFRQGF